MLVITNGDAAVAHLKKAGLEGEWLPWRDVLHEGPVPGGSDLANLSKIRARFLADRGWGDFGSIWDQFRRRHDALSKFRSHSEVLLWFEHDLYDQLQLLQVLQFFSQVDRQQVRISIIFSETYVTELPADRIMAQYIHRRPVTEGQLNLAAEVWNAFCAPIPTTLSIYAYQDLLELPNLNIALRRLFEEFPEINNGLSRNEHQILQLISSGICCPRDLFREHQRMESVRYLGDWPFWSYISGLIQCRNPLIATTDGKPFPVPPTIHLDAYFLDRSLLLTDIGSDVLHGVKNHVQINGIDKWIGGVHLMPGNLWCWDATNQRFEKMID